MHNWSTSPTTKKEVRLNLKAWNLAPDLQWHEIMHVAAKRLIRLLGAALLEQRWKIRGLQNGRNSKARKGGELQGRPLHFTWWTYNSKLKTVNSKVGRSIFALKRKPSSGSMAPGRSHHGNHTGQGKDHWSDLLEMNPENPTRMKNEGTKFIPVGE